LELGEGGTVALNYLSDVDNILKRIRDPTLQEQLNVIKKNVLSKHHVIMTMTHTSDLKKWSSCRLKSLIRDS